MEKKPGKELLISFLGKISLFQKADQNVLAHLADKIVFKTYSPDDAIIIKGEEGNAMYLIFSGEAKVHDGEHRVATLNEGDFW